MKAHLAKVSLALLSAVFLLGCQEQGSEPVGPEGPQFDKPSSDPCPVPRDKGHCHVDDEPTGEATFTATFVNSAGDDCTEVGILGQCHIVGTIVLQETASGLQTFAGVEGTPAMLDLTFFKDLTLQEPPNDWELCFGDEVFTGPFQIIVKKNDLPNVLSFFEGFKAEGTNGSEVTYRLELPGGVVTGTLPPGVGETTTIEIKTFNMRHSSGPGRKFACTGTGDLSSFIKVTRTP